MVEALYATVIPAVTVALLASLLYMPGLMKLFRRKG